MLDNVLLSCLVFNTQSVCNKCSLLMGHVIGHQVDVLFLAETSLTSKKNTTASCVFQTFFIVICCKPHKSLQ